MKKNPGHTLVRHSMQCNYDTADVTALCVEFHLRQSIEELFVKPRSAGSDPWRRWHMPRPPKVYLVPPDHESWKIDPKAR